MNTIETQSKAEWTTPVMVDLETGMMGLLGVMSGGGIGTDGIGGSNSSLTS